MLLLHGDDPWIELPAARSLAAQAAGGRTCAEVGWPMSADYGPLQPGPHQRIAEARNDAQQARQHAGEQVSRMSSQLFDAQRQLAQTQQAAHGLQEQNQHLPRLKSALLADTHVLSQERDEARASWCTTSRIPPCFAPPAPSCTPRCAWITCWASARPARPSQRPRRPSR